ncbi:hypothetical protein OOZ15_02950 [Galbibacter sp. EGI 63066]|uniref:hypothetical protein n=1 Tax=Galbibacter sp. EGI 63066 TaxID=2993559 RepID=UPI002248C624|nr:hypothetical protein [Galbibacter sp. EGI 63066]MCX2678887.1 hypothetical protein [Galbibacter sp. EGI 63066]
MDKWIKKLALLWCKIDDKIDSLFERRVLNNTNGIFAFTMSFIILLGLILVIVYPFDSLSQRILFFFIYTVIGFIAIVIAGVSHEKKRIKNSRLYPFQYVSIKWDTINYKALKFNKEEQIDFNLLLNRRRVQNKINFQENNRSKEGANHRLLFSMFHVLIQDGIDNFTSIQKKDFFEMLMDSFLMNNNPIKYDTLKTSFSNWKGDLNSDKGKSYIKYWMDIFNLS